MQFHDFILFADDSNLINELKTTVEELCVYQINITLHFPQLNKKNKINV